MNVRDRWFALGKLPVVRSGLFCLGCLLLLITPLIGILPGPGGVVTFGAGAALVLKYSEWAKRKYVLFKRNHPNKGRWADWGMRRRSAQRREAIRKEREAAAIAQDD
jgi:hypothetical protein